jgi:hypothetical protein
MVNYIEALVKGLTPWRGVDNLLVSSCIQQIQRDIKSGRSEALHIIQMLGDTEEQRTERFFAWRVRMIDRMMAEYDKGDMGSFGIGASIDELTEDVEYYKALLHKDKIEQETR